MRKRNWPEYNRQLVQRGSIYFLIDPDLLKPQKVKGFGRPQQFSDSMITMLLSMD